MICRSIAYLIGYYSTRSSWIFIPPYLPIQEGSANVTAMVVFKELIFANIAHIELVDVAQWLPIDPLNDVDALSTSTTDIIDDPYSIVQSVVNSFIDDALESIEISRIVECVALLLSRQNVSLSSASFWDQIRNYGRLLVSDSAYRRVFTILCAICKSSWQTIRMVPNTDEPNAKDLGSKLLALDALLGIDYCHLCTAKQFMEASCQIVLF